MACTATAPVLVSNILHRDKFPSVYQTCTATLPALNKPCTMMAKTRAILSLHRDYFPAKVPGPWPDASSSNVFLLYRRAVRLHSGCEPTPCPLKQIHHDILHASSYRDSFLSQFYLDMSGFSNATCK